MFAYCFAVVERLKADRKGVTAMEYGVIAAAIIAVVAGTVFGIGTKVGTALTTVSNAFPS